MSKRKRLITKKVNIYDGQRITESDLDTEQIHNNSIVSNLAIDFHGSGVAKDSPFQEIILLDTRSPGVNNPSKIDIDAGAYDGKGISLDMQPSDPILGSRIEVSLFNGDVRGRRRVTVMILGRAFDGVGGQGELVSEFLEFSTNTSKISKHYYTSISAVFFNNFSGGTGRTENLASAESKNLIGDLGGYIVIRESEPLKVFPSTEVSYQIESPNINLVNFITSSTTRRVVDEISLALGVNNTINDLYVELIGKEKVSFAKDGPTSIVYGQKFLSRVDNIQKIDLLLSVERDTSLPLANQFDYSGDIVVSIHELVSEVSCPTDAAPDDLIDYDPDITPIVEISFGQVDLESLGYKLTDNPQVVSFNFAGTLIADPNIEPSLSKDKYYALLISRRGDNRTGTIFLEKGYNKADKKANDSVPLTILEQFGKRHSKYLEYDPITKRYINDSSSSLWYSIHSDSIEVVNGTAYTDSGVAVTIPKTRAFVGSTEISNFERNINLRTVSEGSNNYVLLSQREEFLDADVHPRTNNRVFTRILDVPEISVVNSVELDKVRIDSVPLILARVNDRNVRSAQVMSGVFDKPGLIGVDTVLLVNPGTDVLSENLVNRIITPDTGCNCNSRYRISRVDCSTVKIGDLDSDGERTPSDLSLLLDLVGNTINSEVTERSILGGELDIIDFIKSDVNNDGTIDGMDIELLESAVDGYVNFSVAEEIKVLVLQLENILEESNYPIVFLDEATTGTSLASTNEVSIVTQSENEALAIRPGDTLSVPPESLDSGDYRIDTKVVEADGLSVTLTVSNLDGTSVVFGGSTGFNSTIISGTEVNLYADNKALTNVPFASANYVIDYIEAPYQESFLEVCDLRRDVGSSFLELDAGSACDCVKADCLPTDPCSPVYKNQTYIPGDLFVPGGNILMAPGVPHHGDFEYTNIRVPLPPGSITDCSLDLYNSFLKSENGGCLTAAGFPAMRYSDGTMVGCEDVGLDTDISKGRVRFSQEVSSLCVDALVDGYVDGYTTPGTAIETSSSVEGIVENFIDHSYTSFDTWTENGLNNSIITNISHGVGVNNPAIFDLTTTSDSGIRFGRLDSPSEIQGFVGDFIVDFQAARTTWQDSSLLSGVVSSFSTLVVANVDGSSATLKLGWKSVAGSTAKLFYSGVIKNSLSAVISTFNFEIEAPDAIGDVVRFRFRRSNDVISAYYIITGKIQESTLNSFGQYVRIGTNPEVQPGSGSVAMTFEIAQENSPTAGAAFFTRLSEVIVMSEYTSSSGAQSMNLGRINSTGEIDRATITLPFNLPRRTKVVSATLEMTAESSGSISDLFNIIPINLLSADNLGPLYNVPLETDPSVITTFSPGAVVAGEIISVDVTVLSALLTSRTGHLPGFIKGFVIEPDATANSAFSISSNVSLVVVYQDSSTGVVFKVGVSIDVNTGIATFNTRNVLFDALREENRTVLNFGVFLKKSGFKNKDVELSIGDLARMGIGTCFDTQILPPEGNCYFIVGNTSTGTFVEGPFPCSSAF